MLFGGGGGGGREGRGDGREGNSIYRCRGCTSYFVGIIICRLVPLKILKSKMTQYF